jgi:N-acetylglucosaminyldiphosphoundecaprenol N-acetyl-beta-D-mannosaminyltransferase
MKSQSEVNQAVKTDRPLVHRTNVLGVGISVINMNDALELSDSLIKSRDRHYVCVTDVHTVIEAQSDAGFRAILNNSYMTTPDGMPLVWVGRLQGHKNMRRVYGPDYLMEMCRVSVERGYRHFFFGGKPGVADRLVAELQQKFPGIAIAGTYTPPFRPLTRSEEDELEDLVAQATPDVFWVGLGSPKQERFMAKYCGRLETKLMVGVGAAFDIHSGSVKEAPKWLKDAGLQWLHRLVQEPRRLWKRYLICVPGFIWNIGLQFLGVRRLSAEARPGVL